jgi:hypothetical protein
MIIQKKIQNPHLAKLFDKLNEEDLGKVMEIYMKKIETKLLKVGKHKPFLPFKPIKLKGDGPGAAEMVIRDRV